MVDPGNSQSDQDTAKRRDDALRRALNTPPKPHNPLGKRSKNDKGKQPKKKGQLQ